VGLLLFTKLNKNGNLQFPDWCPRVYPYTQSVSRVIKGIDPFNYTLMCEPLSEILNYPANTLTYEEMCYNRAQQLKKLDGNIYIMYSGGIDSTSAVLSFVLSWSKEELKRVYIVCTTESINEFPEFWNNIYQTFKGRILSSYVHVEKYCEQGYVVTGEHGDQVFGSDNVNKLVLLFGEQSIHGDWKKYIPMLYDNLFGEALSKRMMEVHAPAIAYCPFEIKTAFEWVWWFNFVNKWQHVKYRMLSFKTWNNPKNNFKKINHFFDTPEWQRWSLDNQDKKIGLTLDTYKLAAKQFIVSNTGFISYLKKPKVGSLSSTWRNKAFYDAIDTDFNYISIEQAMEYVNVG